MHRRYGYHYGKTTMEQTIAAFARTRRHHLPGKRYNVASRRSLRKDTRCLPLPASEVFPILSFALFLYWDQFRERGK